ncbi:HAMP domain-containing histidine kinase [Jiella mangrovi]|uniref:HAMP domain-containing histidine kinase n=1 Tax=Jiella mangrovi TaxID=2821407 RepID=A0ABS4BJS7_9HYPH|nr:HAMP domain-containing histidine kinase [Jiella mangrovi]MBP0616807.1 HAMP domain-containing histidine kinase [Jiella mangrovi]
MSAVIDGQAPPGIAANTSAPVLSPALLRAFCHDCRTPLAVISEFADIVREDLDPAEAQQDIELLTLVHGRVFDIEALLCDLEFLRDTASVVADDRPEPVSAEELLAAMSEKLEQAALRWNQALELQIAPGTPRIEGGPSPFSEIVLALLNDLCRSATKRQTIRIEVPPTAQARLFRLAMWRGDEWMADDVFGEEDDGRAAVRTFRQQFAAIMLARIGGDLILRTKEGNPAFVVQLPCP